MSYQQYSREQARPGMDNRQHRDPYTPQPRNPSNAYGSSTAAPRQQQRNSPIPYNQSPDYPTRQNVASPQTVRPQYQQQHQPQPQPQHQPSSNMEMRQLNQPPYRAPSTTTSSPYQSAATNQGSQQTMTQSDILNECTALKATTASLSTQLTTLESLQTQSLNSANPQATTREIESLAASLTATYTQQLNQLKALKQSPAAAGPNTAPQVALAERELRDTWARYQRVEANYRKRNAEAIERQYRIVRPDASDSEVREAIQDAEGQGQVFAQALMTGQRRDGAMSALNAVRSRHEAIGKIESQMVELAKLFEQLHETVLLQDEKVMDTEMHTENVLRDTEAAVVHLGDAEVSARKARKKKWICFWIGVVTVIVAIIVVLIALKILHVI